MGAWKSRPDQWGRLRGRAHLFRKEPTRSEALLWHRLRAGRLAGLRFRRQHILDRFIVDFYCAACRLIVEVDGDVHDEQLERDRERQVLLECMGMKVLRFRNAQVEAEIEAVLAEIRRVGLSRKKQ